jgi:nucleotide-binding universal stress UspA family protein
MPELLDKLIQAAQEQLAELKKRLAAHGFVVETAVITGQPAQTIVEHAATGGVDLIVMGTHGRTGVVSRVHGQHRRTSGAEGAVRGADGA